jgi:hypothetical protein
VRNVDLALVDAWRGRQSAELTPAVGGRET